MNEQQERNTAEIDLVYLFRPLINAVKKLAGGIANYFKILKQNFLFFSVIVLFISILGYGQRYVIKPSYKTSGIFVSHVLPAKYCSTLLKNLNGLKSSKNVPILAKILGISISAAKDIRSFELIPMTDTFALDLKDTVLSIFRLNLVISKMTSLDTIQWGLVNYLENNEYAIRRKESRKKSLILLRSNLDKKIASLDSLKEIVNSSIVPRSEGKGIILGEPINPVNVYQAEMAYFKEQLYVDQELATLDNIEIIQPFFHLNEKNYPSYNKMFLKAFLAGLGLALLITPVFRKQKK